MEGVSAKSIDRFFRQTRYLSNYNFRIRKTYNHGPRLEGRLEIDQGRRCAANSAPTPLISREPYSSKFHTICAAPMRGQGQAKVQGVVAGLAALTSCRSLSSTAPAGSWRTVAC